VKKLSEEFGNFSSSKTVFSLDTFLLAVAYSYEKNRKVEKTFQMVHNPQKE